MKTQWYHYLAFGITIAILVSFLYLVRGILPPFIIAFVVAWLLDPLLGRLQARGFPRILAVLGVYLVFLAMFTVGLFFLVPAVIDQANDLGRDFPVYWESLTVFGTEQMDKHRHLLERFQLPTTLQEVISAHGHQLSEAVAIGVRATSRWIVANLSVVLWFLLIPLAAFYFLNDMDRIRRKAPLFVPEPWRARTTEVMTRMGQVFSNYVRGLIIVCLLFGLASTLVLILTNFKYSILLGILSGVLYAVPYIGAIVTTIIIILAGLASPEAFHPFWIAFGLLGLNQVFDNAIRPKVLGDSVGLHPVLSLFALMSGLQLFGIVGMLLAVPVAASIAEIIYEFYPEIRPAPKEKRKRLKKPRAKAKSRQKVDSV